LGATAVFASVSEGSGSRAIPTPYQLKEHYTLWLLRPKSTPIRRILRSPPDPQPKKAKPGLPAAATPTEQILGDQMAHHHWINLRATLFTRYQTAAERSTTLTPNF